MQRKLTKTEQLIVNKLKEAPESIHGKNRFFYFDGTPDNPQVCAVGLFALQNDAFFLRPSGNFNRVAFDSEKLRKSLKLSDWKLNDIIRDLIVCNYTLKTFRDISNFLSKYWKMYEPGNLNTTTPELLKVSKFFKAIFQIKMNQYTLNIGIHGSWYPSGTFKTKTAARKEARRYKFTEPNAHYQIYELKNGSVIYGQVVERGLVKDL